MTAAPQLPRSRSAVLDDATVASTAAHLFDERGFRNVTMQALADALRVAKPTLYVHFRSKAAILELICRRVLEQGERHLQAAAARATPEEQLSCLLRSWLGTAVSDSAEYRTFWNAQTELSTAVNEDFRAWSGIAMTSVRNIIVRGQEKGTFRTDLDATVAAFDVIALIMWTPRWYRPGGRFDLDRIAEEHLRLISTGVLASGRRRRIS